MRDGQSSAILKKLRKGDLAGIFVCEVHLPDQEKLAPIYSDNPDKALSDAKKFIQGYLQKKLID